MLLSDLIDFIKTHRSKGRGESFGWTDEELVAYLQWADSLHYLFVTTDEKDFTGVAVMYPLSKGFDGSPDGLIDFKIAIDPDNTDLCIMDFIAVNKDAKNELILQLQERYPNWESQDKWALRFGNPVKITNKYINLLNN